MTMDNKTLLNNKDNQNGVKKQAILPAQIGTDYTYKRKIVWFNAIGFLILHILAVYGYVMIAIGKVSFVTFIWGFIVGWTSGEGVLMGSHRLWTHRSYKAKLPLRIALLILQTIAGQNCVWVWVRDHRQHHKYSDTDADPHNAKRGFFFSHIGWLMSRKHPLVFEYGKNIDMSDLNADKWVMFQKRYYKILYIIFAVIIPTAVPIYFWGEDPFGSFVVSAITRNITILNITWSVNSVAHLYGTRPYDIKLQPVESKFVSVVSFGEGWHNYHHAFPWDYRAAEFGRDWNATAELIDWFAKIGQVYDRRSASNEMVMARIKRCGDGTHPSQMQTFSEKLPVEPRDDINISSEWNAGKKQEWTRNVKPTQLTPGLW